MSKNEEVGFASALRAGVTQDRHPNYRDADGQLCIVRCFVCLPTYGRENYLPAVASGQCVWCGWTEPDTAAAAVGTAGGGQPNASDLGSVETQKGNTE